MARIVAALTVLAALTGCFAFDTVDDQTLVGPYRLQAIDDMESMAIVWDIPGGGTVGDGLPGPTVFAAGYDNRFLVAAVHPQLCPPIHASCPAYGINRDVTQYWFVARSPDERERLPYGGIKGPFTEDQYAWLKRRLNLPMFSVRFRELE